MAIALKSNQVLIIDTGDSCLCDSEYCLPVQDGDVTAIQTDLTQTTGTDLLNGQGDFSAFDSGTGTSAAANKLIDSGATWVTLGVQVGATVYNSTSNAKALVTAVDSETQLSLSANIFPGTDNYQITQWSVVASPTGDVEWNFTSGEIEFNGTIGGVDSCSYDAILTTGRYYQVTFTILSYVSGTLGIYLGTNQIGTVTANGTYTMYGLASGADQLDFAPTAGPYQMNLDAVTLYEMGTIGIDIKDSDGNVVYTETDGTSVTYYDTEAQIDLDWQTYGLTSQECYSVCIVDLSNSSEQQTSCVHYRDSFDCSKKLTWTNGNNAFDFNYTDFTFVQVLRLVDSALRHPSYPEESHRPRFSDGLLATAYGRSTKIEELQTEALPEHIHDALRLGVINQTFTIDGVTYVKQESDYEPIWDRSSCIAPVILPMSAAAQLAANKEC